MPTFPMSLQQPLERFQRDITHSASDNLHSLILYGQVLSPSWREGQEVNLLLMLRQTTPEHLARLELPLTGARRQFRLTPYLLRPEEIPRLCDVFPMKIRAIQRRHYCLWGAPWSQVEVNPEHARIHLEQGLRNLQLRLRARLAGHRQDELALGRHLRELSGPLAIHLGELLHLLGESEVPEESGEIYRRFLQSQALQGQSLEHLYRLRHHRSAETTSWSEVAGEVLAILEEAVKLADSLEAKP